MDHYAWQIHAINVVMVQVVITVTLNLPNKWEADIDFVDEPILVGSTQAIMNGVRERLTRMWMVYKSLWYRRMIIDLKPRPHGGHEGNARDRLVWEGKPPKCPLKQLSKARAMPVVLISRMNDDAARRKTQFLCLIDGNVMELNKGKVL